MSPPVPVPPVPVGLDVTLESQPITLSEADWAAFVGAIENPPKPSAELKKLFRDYPPAG